MSHMCRYTECLTDAKYLADAWHRPRVTQLNGDGGVADERSDAIEQGNGCRPFGRDGEVVKTVEELLLRPLPVGQCTQKCTAATGGEANLAFPFVALTPGNHGQTISFKEGEVPGEGGAVHAQDVGQSLVRCGLSFVNGGEEKELRDAESSGPEGIVVELGKDAGSPAAVKTKTVPNAERSRHSR